MLLRQRQEVQKVSRPRELTVAILASGVFALLGALFIPRAGIEADEALFAVPLYRSLGANFVFHILHHPVPVMDIWYTGTLKTALFWPFLHVFAPSLYALRMPSVLAGAVSILLFFFLARSLAGPVAALIAVVLLATDPTYLLTNTFDFGPVALEHLLLIAACLAMVRGRALLAAFLLGLALWNKATFLWALSGLAAAALIAYGPRCRRLLSNRKRMFSCGIAFLFGALPLILFNLHRHLATLNASRGLSTQDAALKLIELQRALDGSGLFGFLTAGGGASSLFLYALGAAILACFWWPARRAGVFALVFCAVTYLCMFFTRGAGTGIHHPALLAPFPQLIVGIALSALRPRWAMVGAAVLVISNLLVVGQYFQEFERGGPGEKFTDAIFPLADALKGTKETVYVAEWGIYEPLVYLSQGRLPLETTGEARGVVVTHAAGRVQAGKRAIKTIDDSHGRPVFELWR